MSANELERVASSVSVVAIVIKCFAVKFVRTALCDCVGDAACRTSVFSRVVRGVHLKLANRRLADRVVDSCAATLFGEERLVVVTTVDRVVVEQARNSAEAYQTERSIRNGCSAKAERSWTTTSVDRKLIDLCLVEVTGVRVIVRVDDGSFSGNVDLAVAVPSVSGMSTGVERPTSTMMLSAFAGANPVTVVSMLVVPGCKFVTL